LGRPLGGYRLFPRLNGNPVVMGCPAFITVYAPAPAPPGPVTCSNVAGT
jgi:hypothetical protein